MFGCVFNIIFVSVVLLWGKFLMNISGGLFCSGIILVRVMLDVYLDVRCGEEIRVVLRILRI